MNVLDKAEVIHRRGPWRSFEAITYARLERIIGFSHHRILEPIGNIPPAEAEEQFYASTNQVGLAAWLTTNDLRQTRRGPDNIAVTASQRSPMLQGDLATRTVKGGTTRTWYSDYATGGARRDR